MLIRNLGPADNMLLEAFECRVYRQPWTDEVQAAIREGLPERVQAGAIQALGLFDEQTGRLLSLIAWTVPNQEIWAVQALATATGFHGRQHGATLKGELLKRAWAQDCYAVTSLVHRDNEAMLAINKRFQAHIELDPTDPYRNTMLCTIIRPERPSSPGK
jgi:hypothetical protein